MKNLFNIVFSTEKEFLNIHLNVLKKIVDLNMVKMSIPLLVTSQVHFIYPFQYPFQLESNTPI